MKQLYTLLLLLCTFYTHAQVGIGTDAPDPSAQLEISSTDKGLLIPRVTQANRPGSPGKPAAKAGLMIYQTDNDPGFYTFDGMSWEKMIKRSDIPSSSYFQAVKASQSNLLVYGPVNRAVTYKPMPFDSVTHSPDITYNAVTSIVTLSKAGTYQVIYSVTPRQVEGSIYIATIVVNGRNLYKADLVGSSTNPNTTGVMIINVSANSTISLGLSSTYQSTSTLYFPTLTHGGALTITRLY